MFELTVTRAYKLEEESVWFVYNLLVSAQILRATLYSGANNELNTHCGSRMRFKVKFGEFRLL